FVPGAGSTPGKVPVYVEDLERLRQRAARFAPTGRHATVVWLGYDAPPHLIAATRPEPAQRGGPAFASFLDGLRATNRTAHLVAAGHSYGSTVIGEAAATAGLDADAVLLVASPGVR